MQRHEHQNLAYYTFPSLSQYRELRHAVTTRHGGVSIGPYASLNVTKNGDDPAAVEENLRRICAALGIRREDLVSPSQVHQAEVRRVDQGDRGLVYAGYDVLVTDQPEVPLLLRYADCVPVLIYDPAHHALALAHSGWRGTVLGVPAAAVASLEREYGSRPVDLVAAIGPSIGPCCYEIGAEVVAAVKANFAEPDELLPVPAGSSRPHFDLWAAVRRGLAGSGVRQIEAAEFCTACHTDEFFSYRASGGRTGHFGAIMQLSADGV